MCIASPCLDHHNWSSLGILFHYQYQYLSKVLIFLCFIFDRKLAISLIARSRRLVSVDIIPGCRKSAPDISSEPNVADPFEGADSSQMFAPVGIEDKVVLQERSRQEKSPERRHVSVADVRSNSCLVLMVDLKSAGLAPLSSEKALSGGSFSAANLVSYVLW
jgi:hypothetical protein